MTGQSISHSTQQRLVHRQDLSLMEAQSPVDELSVDGGNIRVRTPLGQECQWQGYKAIRLHAQTIGASYKDNDLLIKWVNRQHLAEPLICLGDGHDGIWNIIVHLGHQEQRIEILDGYHLVENLQK